MTNRINAILASLFEQHRIVFWYNCDLIAECGDLPDVSKLAIANNEFGLKYRILRQEPQQKFLLYAPGPQPPDKENWLLDVLLANGQFRADHAGLWLAELGLPAEFAQLIAAHGEFFRSAKRLQACKTLLAPQDGAHELQLKMLAVCADSQPRLDAILRAALNQLADCREDFTKLVLRCNLADFFWSLLRDAFGYASEEPSLKDFALKLFKCAWQPGKSELNRDALVFMADWRDNNKSGPAFRALSGQYARDLDVEGQLASMPYGELLERDCFALIDKKIAAGLVADILNESIETAGVLEIIRKRRQSFWHEDFADLRETILNAALFFDLARKIQPQPASASEAVIAYRNSWHKLDQLYRRFHAHCPKSGADNLLQPLAKKINDIYVNNFLYPLAAAFQAVLPDAWQIPGIGRQDAFFASHVKPYLGRGKVCVIVSDALRYEAGAELAEKIESLKGFSTELGSQLAMLPSCTQLGMAALLPHNQLQLDGQDAQIALANGQSTQGTENRGKILQAHNGAALRADDVLTMPAQDLRDIIRQHDLCYIYHNRIDAQSDKLLTESCAFQAVLDAIEELQRLIRKLAVNNVSNIVVTADHGFIFQTSNVAESDFIDVPASLRGELCRNRRFILGRDLPDHAAMRKFTPEQLGLAGEIGALVPKGLGRLRVKGSGSRYVHGGATLQEIIVPVLKINKNRKAGIAQVEVDILGSATQSITTNQIAVTFSQAQAVAPKIHARKLRAGIYAEDGELISSRHEFIFDCQSQNPRDREQTATFILTRSAANYRGGNVLLKLEERLPGTTEYKLYAKRSYVLRSAIAADFDDFGDI